MYRLINGNYEVIATEEQVIRWNNHECTDDDLKNMFFFLPTADDCGFPTSEKISFQDYLSTHDDDQLDCKIISFSEKFR